MKKQLLLALLLLLPTLAFAGDWDYIKEQDGIKVYEKEVKGSAFVAFKGECILNHPPEKVLWVLADNDHRTEWVDRLERSLVLERLSKHEFIVYQEYALPMFVSDRDYVYRATARRERGGKGRIYLHLASVEHKKAPATVGVRAVITESAYILTPMNRGTKCKIEVEIHTDPKGWMPAWLMNLIQKNWPIKTLNGIRGQLKKDHVKKYELPPFETSKDDAKKKAAPASAKKAAPAAAAKDEKKSD
jgi:hypothetical protein